MSSNAAQRIAEDALTYDAGRTDPNELAELRALIAASDAAHARGETDPADVLLEDIDRIFAER